MYPFRDDIIYLLGYYTALHLNKIEDKKEIMRNLKNIITSRKEASLEEIIDLTGISFEDYLSGKIIKDRVQNNVIALKKKFKVY